jgi:putative hydrolase of the HAD superfamily
MRFTTIFFDLDDTLYPSETGLWHAIKERMNSYMRERMHFPEDQIATVREKYFLQYGTTMRGLQANITKLIRMISWPMCMTCR